MEALPITWVEGATTWCVGWDPFFFRGRWELLGLKRGSFGLR